MGKCGHHNGCNKVVCDLSCWALLFHTGLLYVACLFSSSDTGWSTIKWENTNAVVQKPTSTINMAGLQFVSAPAVQANNNVNIIHTGRKTNPIIETFKCELCNQVKCNATKSMKSSKLTRLVIF